MTIIAITTSICPYDHSYAPCTCVTVYGMVILMQVLVGCIMLVYCVTVLTHAGKYLNCPFSPDKEAIHNFAAANKRTLMFLQDMLGTCLFNFTEFLRCFSIGRDKMRWCGTDSCLSAIINYIADVYIIVVLHFHWTQFNRREGHSISQFCCTKATRVQGSLIKFWSHTITYFNYMHLDTSVFCIAVVWNVTAVVWPSVTWLH